MSALAQELRHLAAVYWREADSQPNPDAHRLLASAWHAQALKPEAGAAIDSIDDCSEVYGDDVDPFAIIDRLDEHNGCSDPRDHLWLTDMESGETRCVHCGVPAMPVYGTREAE